HYILCPYPHVVYYLSVLYLSWQMSAQITYKRHRAKILTSLYLYSCTSVISRPKSSAILHVKDYGAKIHTKKGYCLGIIQNKYSIPIPSPIQTVLSALEFHQIHRLHIETRLRTKEVIPHHRRSGIAPCPEGKNYSINK